jgi:hypothetical protein
MMDAEDLKLKAEIDEIMKSVDTIMQKVETVVPAQQDESQPQSE